MENRLLELNMFNGREYTNNKVIKIIILDHPALGHHVILCSAPVTVFLGCNQWFSENRFALPSVYVTIYILIVIMTYFVMKFSDCA